MTNTTVLDIDHISLDFWNTVAVANPKFSDHRTQLLSDFLQIDLDLAKSLYTSVKLFMDTAAELTGFGTSRGNVMSILNAQLPKEKQVTPADQMMLAGAIDDLFVAFPPAIPEKLPALIQQLVDRGITVNILSNTNFVPGEVLKEHIINPTFGKNILFQMYSDEWEIAKPNSDFFHGMIRGAQALRNGGVARARIMHIGDNYITDVEGAEQVCIQGIHVTNPDDLVRLLEGMLEE